MNWPGIDPAVARILPLNMAFTIFLRVVSIPEVQGKLLVNEQGLGGYGVLFPFFLF